MSRFPLAGVVGLLLAGTMACGGGDQHRLQGTVTVTGTSCGSVGNLTDVIVYDAEAEGANPVTGGGEEAEVGRATLGSCREAGGNAAFDYSLDIPDANAYYVGVGGEESFQVVLYERSTLAETGWRADISL